MAVRNVLVGVVSLIVLSLIGAALVLGHGDPSPSVHLAGGSAWFPTRHQGSIALLDGATGARVIRIDNAAKPDADFTVEQSGSSALVVDRDQGTVTKIDGATWTPSQAVPVASGRDEKLAVRTAGTTAWAVSQGGTVVQQLDTRGMALIGAPQTLPAAVEDVAIGPDGTLWAVAGSGEVRSFRDGAQVTSAQVTDGGRFAIAMVRDRPVVVDLKSSQATLVDPRSGEADRPVCLDLPTDTSPVVGGSQVDEPWLLGVGPNSGTLVVSDVDAEQCHVVPLGPTAADARYGTPVERGRLVFVPDFVAGQVIAVDPVAPAGEQIKARIDIGVTGKVELLVHDDHVWFNDVDGEKAGVITEDLKAISVSKADAGSSQGEAPKAAPAAQPTGGGQAGAGANAGAATGGSKATAAPRGPRLPSPSDNGNGGGSAADAGGAGGGDDAGGGGGGGGDGGGGGGGDQATVEFAASPSTAVVGEPVTFTDRSTGTHTVSGWAAPDGTPSSSANGSATFVTTFKAPGTFDVTLTVDGAGGAQSVTHQITVDTQRRVPDVRGLTPFQAQKALNDAGLSIGINTGSVETPLKTGLVADTDPPKGTAVARNAVVTYRTSNAKQFVSFSLPVARTSQTGGVAGGADGNTWVTAPATNQIVRVTPDGVSTPFPIKTPGSGPQGIARGPDGNMWFTERTASKIARITPDGQVTEFPTRTLNAAPAGITGGADGNVWFTENAVSKVGVITPDGNMNEFPTPRANSFPGAITLGPDNNIWVAEIGTSFVDRIAPNGSFTGSFKLPNQPATNLAAGPNGNVLFTTISGVGILDPRVNTPPPVFPSAFRPSGIVLGHDGNIWYSETNVVDLGSGPGDVVAINRQGQQILKAPVDLFSQAPAQIFNGPGDMLWFMLNGHAARLVVA